MRTFTSQDAALAVSHPDLKKAAGSDQFVLRFLAGSFSTENEALADALASLVEAGNLKGVIEHIEPKAPEPEPPKKEAADGPKRRRGQ